MLNIGWIVGKATKAETLELVGLLLLQLPEEELYEALLDALTAEQIEELHAAMEQRQKRQE